jgi:DNA repair protein SbcC/Rad50
VSSADGAVAAAESQLEEARRRELVHALTDGLHAGDDCPVCGTALADEPAPPDDRATAAARSRLEEARNARTAAAATVRDADRAAATAAERHQAAEQRVADARAARAAARQAAGAVDHEQVERLLAEAAAADAAVSAARDEDRAARREETAARAAVDAARAGEEAAWRTLDTARDAVARLGPPTPERRDLAAAWDTLLRWAEATRPVAVARADDAAEAVVAARERYASISGQLREACAREGVDVPPGTAAGVAVAEALATTRARLETLTERVEQVATVTAERDAARDDARVAEHLGKLLRADAFERWLLSRALTRLVTGASTLLRELSSGAYSLALDATNQFLVVDHRNADEPRSVRSLSGGERFLASLALALALADHVAELAADGAARLESLFLDEGFGTLDPDTLDVVAAALEELGARGRVVGIVTHVRDLAERLPVRFEVRKGPTTSSVVRVDEGVVTSDGGASGAPVDGDATSVDGEEVA